MKTEILFLRTQKRSAVKLIRETCANYNGGLCLSLDTPCPQIHSDTVLCLWFRNVVLPSNKALHTQIIKANGFKLCLVCGKVFRASSNHAKYCPECGRFQRREQEARRLRNLRAAKRR